MHLDAETLSGPGTYRISVVNSDKKTEMSLLPWGPLIGYFVEHERKWFVVSEYRELPSLDEVPELLHRQVYR